MGTFTSKSATCRKKSKSRLRGCDVGLVFVDKAKPIARACAPLSPPAAEVRPVRDNNRNTIGTAHLGNLILLAYSNSLYGIDLYDSRLRRLLYWERREICSFVRSHSQLELERRQFVYDYTHTRETCLVWE